MNRRWRVILLVVLPSLGVSGCMHGLMMGGHGMGEDSTPTPVRHEASSGTLRLSVDIPSMTLGSEGTIRFVVSDRTSVEVPRVVSWRVQVSAVGGHASHSSASRSDETPLAGGVAPLENGVGDATFTPGESGRHLLTAEVSAEHDTLRAEVTFEVRDGHGGTMMGMGDGWAAPVVIVVAMGSMMIAMWAIRVL